LLTLRLDGFLGFGVASTPLSDSSASLAAIISADLIELPCPLDRPLGQTASTENVRSWGGPSVRTTL
jgi:hypothetical protein